MRTMVAVAALAAAGCGSVRGGVEVNVPSDPTGPDTTLVITAIGRFVGGCHACPVAADKALTAAHCVDMRPFDLDVPLWPMHGESPSGWRGLLVPEGAQSVADLAALRPEPRFTRWYDIGRRPERGAAVTLVGFARKKDDPLGRRVEVGEVTSVIARHFVTTAWADFGSSGGCVLDAGGRLVGIVSAALLVDEFGRKYHTKAVGVWE